MQLKINNPNDTVFEWISCNQFNIIKEIGKGGFATVYSAIWKNGPLRYIRPCIGNILVLLTFLKKLDAAGRIFI